MLTFLAILAALNLPVALAAGGAEGFLLVGDPVGVVQCDQYTITWQGGVAPFAVTVQDPVNAGDIYAFWAIVEDNFIVWDVDQLPKGSVPLPIRVSVTDSTGGIHTSQAETVAPATVPLDSSGLCTSILTTAAGGSTDTTSTSDTTSTTSTTSTDTNTDTTTDTTTNTPTDSATSTQAKTSAKSGASTVNTMPSATAAASSSSASAVVTTTKKLSTGVIAGAAIAGVVVLGLLGALFIFLRKRHQKKVLADLTETDYHLALGGKPAAEAVVEKPLPAFYEQSRPESTPSPHPSSGYPYSEYHDKPQPSPYHDAPYSMPQPNHHPVDLATQQIELERQINVMQQEINGMQYSNAMTHTQTLQNQVNTMRGELERLRLEHHGHTRA